VTWQGDYYPFGEPFSSNGTPDRYRFTQHELDPATDLIYAKARYYHPRIGRFLTVDPVGGRPGSSQSWNRYTYVLNNPLRWIDPFGKQHVPEGYFIPWGKPKKPDLSDLLDAAAELAVDPNSIRPGLTPEKIQQLLDNVGQLRLATDSSPHSEPTPDTPTSGDSAGRSIENPESFRGATYDEVVEAIPDDWQADPATSGVGVRYAPPKRKGDQVRIMRGSPFDSDPVKKGPCVNISLRGKTTKHIPLAGNPESDQKQE
jgi:RHS repeat-associated protein